MDFLTGNSKNAWQPIMTVDTTTSDYWLNWRVLLCGIWVLISMLAAFFLIFKYEGSRHPRPESGETQQRTAGLLYEDEVWRPCLKEIHPAWLLAFRVFAFCVLLSLLIINAFVDGGSIFYFYTQWTFTSITIYFWLGSLLSLYGCYQYHNRIGGDRIDNEGFDAEQGTNVDVVPKHRENSNRTSLSKASGHPLALHNQRAAGFWAYVFQIIFQMNAGAVVLTDCVFWFIIVPFLAIKDYNLNFLIINMHTINAVFLFGDTVLSCMQFPWFRIAYFFLWTATFVIFQWILHACVSVWWPYPFLDLSSSLAPLWYLAVALMHVPCYGIFALIMKLKHFLLSRWFPETYQCMR
ncbi:uncharacterized protein LOC131146148 [Malania oleifera]|uniref:uncharacterized protein LOC131146148 n=1 Tax=Malania oleifera TaxID=397392 RepID=UPI0025AE84A6|nr:uncharacterized protein LOC131146148 [Malania oleifera]